MKLPALTLSEAIKGLRDRRRDFRSRRGASSPNATKLFSEAEVAGLVDRALATIANSAPRDHSDDPILLFGFQQHELTVSRAAMAQLNLNLYGGCHSDDDRPRFGADHIRDPNRAEALRRLLQQCQPLVDNIEVNVCSATPWGGPDKWGDWVVTIIVPNPFNET
jgi:hypothetical protein